MGGAVETMRRRKGVSAGGTHLRPRRGDKAAVLSASLASQGARWLEHEALCGKVGGPGSLVAPRAGLPPR